MTRARVRTRNAGYPRKKIVVRLLGVATEFYNAYPVKENLKRHGARFDAVSKAWKMSTADEVDMYKFIAALEEIVNSNYDIEVCIGYTRRCRKYSKDFIERYAMLELLRRAREYIIFALKKVKRNKELRNKLIQLLRTVDKRIEELEKLVETGEQRDWSY